MVMIVGIDRGDGSSNSRASVIGVQSCEYSSDEVTVCWDDLLMELAVDPVEDPLRERPDTPAVSKAKPVGRRRDGRRLLLRSGIDGEYRELLPAELLELLDVLLKIEERGLGYDIGTIGGPRSSMCCSCVCCSGCGCSRWTTRGVSSESDRSTRSFRGEVVRDLETNGSSRSAKDVPAKKPPAPFPLHPLPSYGLD